MKKHILFVLLNFMLLITPVFAQDGFIFQPWNDIQDSELKAKMEMIKETGASHVTFLVFICQYGLHSVQPGECNDYQADLSRKIKWGVTAKEVGLSFDITPFPFGLRADGAWDWRGQFKPSDLNLWFQNYGVIIKDITDRAFKAGASYQIVGNEMQSLHKHTGLWIDLATELRPITNRPLIMNVNWFEVPHRFWKAYDVIGISAYYPIALRRSSSAAAMARYWKIAKSTILLFSKIYGKPFQFTEVGYPSVDGGARFPSNHDFEGRKIDLEEQRRAFEAFRKVWQNDKRLLRALIWATDVPANDVDRSQDPTYDPFNKPALNEIKEFFLNRKK